VEELRERSHIFVELLRLIVVGAFAVGGYELAHTVSANRGPAGVLVGVVLGTATGYVLGGILGRTTATALSSLERHVARVSGGDILAGVLGTIFGVILAFVACWPVLLIGIPVVSWSAGLVLVLILGRLGYRIGRIKRDDLLALLGMEGRLGPGRAGPGRAAKLLDTSVLIDARVTAMVRAGWLEGRLIAPSFVLAELQGLADADDPARRTKGKRGLETLAILGRETGIVLEVVEREYPDTVEVDAKLLRLARERDLSLLTTDHNLARVAELSGLLVLNPNVLADAVRPPMLPGERVSVTIQKPGREAQQGVGYLDDGTMVVVEGARDHVGERVEVSVSSVLQNAQGRMVFARLARSAHEESGTPAGKGA
jgi:uncharacterized protein YacL